MYYFLFAELNATSSRIYEFRLCTVHTAYLGSSFDYKIQNSYRRYFYIWGKCKNMSSRVMKACSHNFVNKWVTEIHGLRDLSAYHWCSRASVVSHQKLRFAKLIPPTKKYYLIIKIYFLKPEFHYPSWEME